MALPAGRFAVLTTLAGTNWASGEAQSPIVIRGPAPCSECGIEVQHLMTLGDTLGGPAEIHKTIRRVDMDSRGRYYISFGESEELPAVFDRSGRYFGRLGPLGSGPGEFRDAFIVEITNDSIYVADRVPPRLTSLALHDPRGEPGTVTIREFASGALSTIRLSTGQVVSNIALMSGQEIGYPLHIFSRDGQKLKSFGSVTPEYLPDRRHLLYRLLTPGEAGRFWVAHHSANRLEEYDSAGALLRTVEIRTDWFPENHGSLQFPQPGGPPPAPSVVGIHFDAPSALLWVAVWVPDLNWQRGFGPRKSRPGAPRGYYHEVEDWSRIYDTVMQVVDTRRTQVLIAQRLDQAITSIGAGRIVAHERLLRDGLKHVEIRRLSYRP